MGPMALSKLSTVAELHEFPLAVSLPVLSGPRFVSASSFTSPPLCPYLGPKRCHCDVDGANMPANQVSSCIQGAWNPTNRSKAK